MMGRRLRIVGWQIQPVMMVDDGENLTPLPVQPVEVPHSRWEEFAKAGWRDAVEQIRVAVEQADTDSVESR
ncbi:MAG: hypothetical protein M3O70_08935 [Actinomycetota bacterium]|nr:hypothetical protein [Actinomycetota bacterium]